ncbi:uncharacterized protein B0T15DRAFT_485519 [Chaetomium strumarium]|uniref:Nuclear transport factor 2 n=1 Tax=Chaetomium strumarium TaxID=1170767 RepID=A0AAJ0GTV6_9PEZI|nr:hypothetical protein B0T15DRAFT_485519 [Chaetomium strumarium]
MAAADFKAMATNFVNYYYNTFDTDRKKLGNLYRENSMLISQDNETLGAASIAETLAGLPFQKVVHKFSVPDAQPTPNGGVIILVIGELFVDDSTEPLVFSQGFQLCQDPAGTWFISNDIFKLVVF